MVKGQIETVPVNSIKRKKLFVHMRSQAFRDSTLIFFLACSLAFLPYVSNKEKLWPIEVVVHI